MTDTLVLLISSFLASLGFGIVFRIQGKYLLLAGLSGLLTRIVYLAVLQFTTETFLCCFLGAMAATLFSEAMGAITKNPSTVFVYPAIVPLMPGGSLYYTIVGLVLGDMEMVNENLSPCIHSLIGLGLGFIVISIVLNYVRIYRNMQKKTLLGFILHR